MSRQQFKVSSLLIRFLIFGLSLTQAVKVSPEVAEQPAKAAPSLAWTNIRIKFDFSLTNVPTNVMVYLQSTVFSNVQRKLQSIISIRDSADIQPFSVTNCEAIIVPNAYKTQTTLADLVIFVLTSQSSETVLAFSSPCAYMEQSNRPRVGMINVNLNYLRWGADQIDATISTMMHETLHILIMSPSLYYNYLTVSSSTYVSLARGSGNNTQNVQALATPGLLSFAREYFNCPTMQGVFLENQGNSASQNSHWNKLLLGNELMTSQRTGYPSFSLFTYYLMNDSGWYQLDFSTADAITWGKYGGCNFVNSPCDLSYAEFCSNPDQLSCSTDYRAKTVCTQSQYTPGCFYNEFKQPNLCSNTVNFAFTSPYEEPGKSARCFNVNINGANTANCYKFQCVASGVLVQVQGANYTCTAGKQTIKINQQLTIVCPDINSFCNAFQNSACPNDCNGQGTCSVTGVCKCNYFYTGSSCETKIPCQTADSSICSILQQTNLPPVLQMSTHSRISTIAVLLATALSFS